MKVIEAIISEIVESYAIVTLDDNGHIVEVEQVEEKDRYNLEVIDILKEIEEDESVSDPREV